MLEFDFHDWKLRMCWMSLHVKGRVVLCGLVMHSTRLHVSVLVAGVAKVIKFSCTALYPLLNWCMQLYHGNHGLRTLGEEIDFTARPKIHSHSQIFRYGRSIFCLPHRPKFSDFFDLCLHWVSVVRVLAHLQVWKISFKHCGINMRMLHQNSLSPFVIFFLQYFGVHNFQWIFGLCFTKGCH